MALMTNGVPTYVYASRSIYIIIIVLNSSIIFIPTIAPNHDRLLDYGYFRYTPYSE